MPIPRCTSLDQRGAGEAALVRRALRLEDRVETVWPSRASSSWSSVLWSTWRRHRVLDALGEGLHDRAPGSARTRARGRARPSAASTSAARTLRLRARRLELRARRRAPTPRAAGFRARAGVRRSAQLVRLTTYAQAFVSRPSEKSGKALVELLRDRELEDAVAEELETLVRARSVLDERRVGEGALAKRRPAARRSG